MYAPPSTVVPARQGFTQGPLLAACLLGLILFLIAATIVLALIPLYLPTHDATLVGTTNPSTFVLTPNKQLGNDGTLSAAATSTINSQIAKGLGFGSNAIQSGNGVVSSTSSGKRKRRGFTLIRNDRQANGQKVYIFGSFLRSVCGVCKVTIFDITITATFVYGTTTITITFAVEVFFDQAISIPATLASTTSTTISSGNGTTTAGTTGNTTTSSNSTTSGNLTNSTGSG
jgi:hypothetical protein